MDESGHHAVGGEVMEIHKGFFVEKLGPEVLDEVLRKYGPDS